MTFPSAMEGWQPSDPIVKQGTSLEVRCTSRFFLFFFEARYFLFEIKYFSIDGNVTN